MKHSIFALASARGRAGVSIIRISGSKALWAAQQLTTTTIKPRVATYTPLIFNGEHIDDAVLLWFKAPQSFTGEDCVELHVHGSQPILDLVFETLKGLGLELAKPGEFSRRALENGKLDLTQAEAIADLVDAESQAQRQQALKQLGGGLKAQYETWQVELIELLANLEVWIDFPDEDLPPKIAQGIIDRMERLESSLTKAIADSRRGQQIREGYRVVILGEPNAGKSSLFNALLGTDSAIVTAVAGTTRDVLEAQLRMGAYSVWLYDTAGLRETDEAIEQEGIRRARLKGEEADLRLWVIDGSLGHEPPMAKIESGDFLVFNKVDQSKAQPGIDTQLKAGPSAVSAFEISVVTGQGVDALRRALEAHITLALSMQTFPAATRVRHLDRLIEARDQLALARRSNLAVPELTAEHVRSALNSFEALFGRYDIEGVLDAIFSNFCIGK